MYDEEPLSSRRVAEPLDAKISKEDTAMPIPIARRHSRRSRVVDTTPVVEGDWLSDKDIAAWLNNKLYHNEVGEPQAWVGAVRCVVSHLPEIKV